jgi:hypothetical protein
VGNEQGLVSIVLRYALHHFAVPVLGYALPLGAHGLEGVLFDLVV